MEIQDIAQSQGLQSGQSQQAVTLLKAMLSSPTEGKHTCDPADTPIHEVRPNRSCDGAGFRRGSGKLCQIIAHFTPTNDWESRGW